MKPRLCHVFSTFGNGGPEVRTCQLIDASLDNYDHVVVSISGELVARDRFRQPDLVQCLAAPPATGTRSRIAGLARLLGDLRPDLTLTYGWGGVDALLAARRAGFRRVLHAEDGFLPDEAHGQKPRRLWMRRVALRLARRVVCPSQTLMRIARQSWWLGTARTLYIPNGVHLDRFHPVAQADRDSIRERLGFAASDLVVGTVGLLRAEKNHARLIRAFAQVRLRSSSTRLVILGDGALRGELLQLVNELGLAKSVSFPGMIADPAPWYQAMDLFALSSDTEQMPLSVLEAMATGLAVVSTKVGDVADMVAPRNQEWITAAGDATALATSIENALSNEIERKARGEANRARALAEFGFHTMVERYMRLYAGALAGIASE